jgi:excisionase family DNA binding protein
VNERRHLSPKEYAQRHGVSTRTVHRWIRDGRLVVVRMTKRTIRIAGMVKQQPDKLETHSAT